MSRVQFQLPFLDLSQQVVYSAGKCVITLANFFFFFFGTVRGYSDPEFAVVTLEKLLHSLSVKREVHFLWQPGKLAQGKSKGGSSERG